MQKNYDIIVVGAGHAGCEAAASAASMGKSVLLITMNMQTIAQMSCNPAMGGVAKGQILREIDALGGFQQKLPIKQPCNLECSIDPKELQCGAQEPKVIVINLLGNGEKNWSQFLISIFGKKWFPN